MDNTDYRITLDITDMSAPVSLNVKQGDAGRKIAITLTRDGIPVHIAEGSYAVFAGKKPDEKVLWNSCSIDGDTIIYEITKQTTAVVGWVPVQIRLYSHGGKLVSSPDFVLIVDGTVTDDNEVVAASENEVTALTELVSEASAAIEHAMNAEGKSAYQVAQEAGFEGTVEEWLESLEGKHGEPGKDGSSTIIKLLYGVSSEPLENTVITWQDTIPQMSETYPYLWIEISTETKTATEGSASIERGIIGYYSTGGEGTVQQQGFDFPATKELNMNGHSINGVGFLAFASVPGEVDGGAYIQNDETLFTDGHVSGQVLGIYGSCGDEPVILRNIHKPVENSDAATKQYVDDAIKNARCSALVREVYTGTADYAYILIGSTFAELKAALDSGNFPEIVFQDTSKYTCRFTEAQIANDDRIDFCTNSTVYGMLLTIQIHSDNTVAIV